MAFVDDTLVVVFLDVVIYEVFYVYGRFELGIGFNFNFGKCEGLWLGFWRIRVDFRWILI